MSNFSKNKIILSVLTLLLLANSFAAYQVQALDLIDFLDIKTETINGKTVKVKWQTNIPTKGKIIYGKTKDSFPYFIIDTSAPTTLHESALGNLETETTYYFQVIAQTDNEETYSFINSFKTEEYNDLIAPKINDLKVSYIGDTIAVFTWSTDKEATSRLEYDTELTYKISTGDNSRKTSHRLVIKNLKPNAYYYFRLSVADKFNNRGGYAYREFRTLPVNNAGKEDLIISHFRPSGQADTNIGSDSVLVSFKTNHFANGRVVLSGRDIRTQTKNLDDAFYHQADFTGLSPGSEYTLYVSMTDIFNKRAEVRDIKFTAKSSQSQTAGGNVALASGSGQLNGSTCQEKILNNSGYYGRYFNLSPDLPNIKAKPSGSGLASGWYDNQYFSFARLDANLNFGNRFLPLNENKPGDPYYFSVYWRALIEVPVGGKYTYKISSDDDSWVFVDRGLTTDLGGLHAARTNSQSIDLGKGWHGLEVFFVERKPVDSVLNFSLDGSIKIHPWPLECDSVLTSSGGLNFNNATGGGSGVVVKGVEFSLYTPPSALLKTADSPDVYAIVNGQRHYISSPASFTEYGYKWSDIKTVNWAELSKYPRARLLKSPNRTTIYHLYQRPENLWLKIDLPSPTAFVSYPDNYWGNVITVTELDLNAYPDVRLIKSTDSNIYWLENNIKHLVSDQVFVEKKFVRPEIAEVSKIHLNTYQAGESLR